MFAIAFVMLFTLAWVSSSVDCKTVSYHDLDDVPGFAEAWRDAEMALKEILVPGLVITVVQGDESSYKVYSKAYGLADIRNSEDRISFTKSKFAIGSISKSFAVMLLGILLTDHKDKYPLGWDTRVKSIMGDSFSMKSSIEDLVTLKNILSHTTGTYSYSPALTMGLVKKSPDEYCRRMNILDGSGELNEYHYNNLMYLLAECIIEKIGQDTYANLIKRRILGPLKMLNTTILGQPETLGFKDTPLMYFRNVSSSTLVQLDINLLRVAEVLTAAGGILSTGEDMARWIILHIEKGRTLHGKQLLDTNLWKGMHSSQVMMLGRYNSTTNYSLGWILEKYKDMNISYHGGRIAGFDSKVSVILEEKLGVFTSANGPAYNGYYIQYNIHKMIYDVFHNQTPQITRGDGPTPQSFESDCTEAKPHAYLGTFGNAFFGNFTISTHSNKATTSILRFQYGLFGRGCLSSTNATFFTPTMDEPLRHYHFTTGAEGYKFRVIFSDMDEGGRYNTLEIIDEDTSVFKRGYKWDSYGKPAITSNSNSKPKSCALATLAAAILARQLPAPNNVV